MLQLAPHCHAEATSGPWLWFCTVTSGPAVMSLTVTFQVPGQREAPQQTRRSTAVTDLPQKILLTSRHPSRPNWRQGQRESKSRPPRDSVDRPRVSLHCADVSTHVLEAGGLVRHFFTRKTVIGTAETHSRRNTTGSSECVWLRLCYTSVRAAPGVVRCGTAR